MQAGLVRINVNLSGILSVNDCFSLPSPANPSMVAQRQAGQLSYCLGNTGEQFHQPGSFPFNLDLLCSFPHPITSPPPPRFSV